MKSAEHLPNLRRIPDIQFVGVYWARWPAVQMADFYPFSCCKSEQTPIDFRQSLNPTFDYLS
jgi:hypothetical protein